MSENADTLKPLLDRMVEAKQLSAIDADAITRQAGKGAASSSAQSEDDILRWLAAEYAVAYTALDDVEPDRQLLSLFPARILLKEQLLPLRRTNGTVEVATSRLFATQGLDALKTMTGLKLKPVLAPREAIEREIKKRLGVGADTIGTLDEETAFEVVDENGDEDSDLDSAAEDASIIRFVNQVLKDAIELRASDIHLEPFEDELRIRYRIDGVLQEVPVPAQIKRFQPAIVSRVKILSHLNIAEKRLPQDGRIKIRIEESEVDIRVSVIPMLHGEAVVMRLLRQNSKLRGLSTLGMDRREMECFKRVLELPHGIVLVTGPTGSGKTSTLYTALNEINDAVRKIITIEDPVEYELPGVLQIPVNERKGLTFAKGLRSILRHDPDRILVGEIRDAETAEIAVQSSLTGHLVFTTVHANSMADIMGRFRHFGLDMFGFMSSLNGVVVQRLVRQLCPACGGHRTANEREVRWLASMGQTTLTQVPQAVGCGNCRGTGYKGRFVVAEVHVVDDVLRDHVTEGAPVSVLRRHGVNQGVEPLTVQAARQVALGRTTLEEVKRVIGWL
jgi:general secretion pathway protein E/type IV pilus assembly protein PilB